MGLNLRVVMIVRSLGRKILKRNIPSKFGRLPVYIAAESSVLICNIPSGIRKVSDQYKSINASVDIDFANTTALFLYFLFGCTSVSQLAREYVNSPSVSELTRAIANFPGNRFMRRCRRSILNHYDGQLAPNDFVFAIDDTSNPRHGKTIFGCQRWNTHGGGYFGQKILVLALVDIRRNIAIPLGYAFLTSKLDPNYSPILKRAVRLVDECLEAGFPKLPVVTDSWFDSKELMESFSERGITFVTELKSKRRVRNGSGYNVPYKPLSDHFSEPFGEVYARPLQEKRGRGRPNLRFTEAKVLQIKTYKTPIKVVAVYNKRSSRQAFGYFASTDRTMPGATVWKIYRARWAIEVLFRDLKQNLSFGTLPCGGENASDLAVCMPFAIITSLRLKANSWQIEEGLTIGKSIAIIKERVLRRSIDLIGLESSKALRTRIRARRDPSRFGQKPVDRIAA